MNHAENCGDEPYRLSAYDRELEINETHHRDAEITEKKEGGEI